MNRVIQILQEILVGYPFHSVALYCIRHCHQELGQTDLANQVFARIYELLKTDSRARQMHKRYADLMEDICFDVGKYDTLDLAIDHQMDEDYLSVDALALSENFKSSVKKIKTTASV